MGKILNYFEKGVFFQILRKGVMLELYFRNIIPKYISTYSNWYEQVYELISIEILALTCVLYKGNISYVISLLYQSILGLQDVHLGVTRHLLLKTLVA